VYWNGPYAQESEIITAKYCFGGNVKATSNERLSQILQERKYNFCNESIVRDGPIRLSKYAYETWAYNKSGVEMYKIF
jgi:hypothetical protein